MEFFRRRAKEGPLNERAPSDRNADVPVAFERRGHRHINGVVVSARQVPWTVTLVQLLWTAGPITFLALQAGSLLGFGRAASTQTFVYFAVYTLLLGVLGVMVRIATDAAQSRRQREAERELSETIDILPDLMFSVRDLSLAGMDKEERRRGVAGILLRKADLGPETLALAVVELTGDRALADIAERIEIFRRLGLTSRVQDLIDASSDARGTALARLREKHPDVAELLRQRLLAQAPDPEDGVPRGDQFIYRVVRAGEEDNVSLVTLPDVEQLLVLTFELLCGREIPRLTIGHRGRSKLAPLFGDLEAARNAYWLAESVALSQLRALGRRLIAAGVEDISEAQLRGWRDQVIATVAHALERWLASVEGRRGRTKAPQRVDPKLRYALRQVLEAIRRLRAARLAYLEQVKRWERARRQAQDRRVRHFGAIMRIEEHALSLDNAQKLWLAERFQRLCRQRRIIGRGGLAWMDGRPLDADGARELALELGALLEPLIQLSDPSVQRAIYASPAAYLGALEAGMSRETKAGIGSEAAAEVRCELGRAAEALALRLHRRYKLPVSQAMIDFLVEHYGADRSLLETFTQGDRDQGDSLDPSDPSHVKVAVEHFASAEWKSLLRRIERVVEGRRSRQPDHGSREAGRSRDTLRVS